MGAATIVDLLLLLIQGALAVSMFFTAARLELRWPPLVGAILVGLGLNVMWASRLGPIWGLAGYSGGAWFSIPSMAAAAATYLAAGFVAGGLSGWSGRLYGPVAGTTLLFITLQPVYEPLFSAIKRGIGTSTSGWGDPRAGFVIAIVVISAIALFCSLLGGVLGERLRGGMRRPVGRPSDRGAATATDDSFQPAWSPRGQVRGLREEAGKMIVEADGVEAIAWPASCSTCGKGLEAGHASVLEVKVDGAYPPARLRIPRCRGCSAASGRWKALRNLGLALLALMLGVMLYGPLLLGYSRERAENAAELVWAGGIVMVVAAWKGRGTVGVKAGSPSGRRWEFRFRNEKYRSAFAALNGPDRPPAPPPAREPSRPAGDTDPAESPRPAPPGLAAAGRQYCVRCGAANPIGKGISYCADCGAPLVHQSHP